jgi:t-SNARE complex subunit (syntaxin)
MAEVLIEERDEEIRKVVEAIAELAQIMRDLSTLVVEQGTMLDRIDANIGQAAVKVRSARAGRWRGLHAGAGARHRAGEHAALVLRAQHALCCVHTHTHPTAASRCACACSCACAWPCAQVEEGVKELVRAEKTQRQGRAMLCIIALLVLIVVMVIVIIVRHI